MPKLSDVGRAGAGVGVGVEAGVVVGGIVADEPDRNTIKPLVSLVSYGPVRVAVIMSVVNDPAKCSAFPVLAPSFVSGKTCARNRSRKHNLIKSNRRNTRNAVLIRVRAISYPT